MVPKNFDEEFTGVQDEQQAKKKGEAELVPEENVPTDCLSDSEGSSSEFERKLKTLLPDLHVENDALEVEQPLSTRRSERPKKPPSRFIENAGYVAEPPK